MNLVSGRVSSAAGRVAVDFLGQTARSRARSPMPSHASITARSWSESAPEDLRLVSDAPASYSTRLQGVVDVVEPLGSETYVVVKMGDSTLIGPLPAAHRGRPPATSSRSR